MKNLFIALVLSILLVSFSNCCKISVSINCPFKRFIDVDENDYQTYMNSLDWDLLKNPHSNVTLSISGEKFGLTPEFMEKMEKFH